MALSPAILRLGSLRKAHPACPPLGRPEDGSPGSRLWNIGTESPPEKSAGPEPTPCVTADARGHYNVMGEVFVQ